LYYPVHKDIKWKHLYWGKKKRNNNKDSWKIFVLFGTLSVPNFKASRIAYIPSCYSRKARDKQKINQS